MITKAQHPLAEEGEMIQAAFQFWLDGMDHVRSPFPKRIHETLQERTLERFRKWISQLDERAQNEVTDEVVAAKFEEILFETALPLVETEDERISVLFPFLPRVGDEVREGNAQEGIPGIVQSRRVVIEEERPFLLVTVSDEASGRTWTTQLDLPA